ncbi:MAG: outer membrane lipid asymmetry maintenance protein MlaD [Orrella sp.]|jgi:phospholipid/cholesterol/gamma-HCH transport system substrate-binding protein|uniref:outer membrane lipid asymmetry maintenance protein MlaD n=1 Tax=Orrella sp. TaxID=1921583 RepID=UPI003BBB5607
MSNQKVDVWVGLFVMLGIVALLFLALRAGNLSSFSLADTYAVQARFDNIGGLKVRAPVKSAGVVVGRVADIRFDDQTYKAVVTVNLERNFEFPADTSASILTSGLLGEQFIGLDAGGEDRMLVAGDDITLTQSAIILEQLISQFLYGSAEREGAVD